MSRKLWILFLMPNEIVQKLEDKIPKKKKNKNEKMKKCTKINPPLTTNSSSASFSPKIRCKIFVYNCEFYKCE